ncbi:alpha/beta hydrolase [Nisaea acidiphila]|uniref:Alpha/beta hydrolase n=1 Tax=Nisaea acidiphila TaxID=1862145 RepID=A0A9J7AWV2_9PROT|nr:alpha/beta hydrolase [Nisaea acidiphila]UUX49925.1 alpha/beta hydrolase [Nisaea acidiphila]
MSDIVFLSGFMCDSHLWDRVAPGLEADFRLHFGDLTRDRTFEGMAERVLAAAPRTFSLVGFSMGGFVAREIALKAPERVERLALLNTSARGDDPEQARRKAGLARAAETRGFRGLSRHSILSSLHPDRRGDEEIVASIREMADRIGREGFVNQIGVVRQDGHGELSRITCPALVVWCRQDELRSLEEAQELADGIPGAELRIVENCGHMLPLEAPGETVSLLRNWLSSSVAA